MLKTGVKEVQSNLIIQNLNSVDLPHTCILVICPKNANGMIIRQKEYICVFQATALKKLGMIGRHYILFYRNILYGYCIFYNILAHFLAYLTIFCSQFTIKCLGSGQKPR